MGQSRISQFLCVAMLFWLILAAAQAVSAQDNPIEAVGTKVADVAAGVAEGVENWRSDLVSRIDDTTGGISEFFTTANDLLKKFAAVIAVVFVVLLGVLLRYVANLALVIIVGLLILLGRRHLAKDLKAVIEGLIGAGILVGSIVAWIEGTRGGLLAGISAAVSVQVATWIMTLVGVVVIRIFFPGLPKFFAEIRETVK
ncbi:MAG: hypothetical protein OXG49_12060 [Chloroflexi bacterium]|nr:hypothetical protein [Chloroflexota bacterium]